MGTNYETIIGLEVHAELSTKSKIFCGCSTVFGEAANTQVCPVCSGMPGALPVLNRAVVECAVKTGLALNCGITQDCKFDRKNYFYPDLPKAYQVSQLYLPICRDGHLDIGGKKIGIREIHMEEDAGKLIHGADGSTHMDFNRCGVPLLEIVTNPDFRNAGEVDTYLTRLREILLYLGVCDCKMQEGSLRVDVNLSVRKKGAKAFGTRTETKNLNSFKAVSRAIAYETARQIAVVEAGGKVIQETRRWDDDKGESYGMRSKENAQDYRYFPEPDLLPISISNEWLERIGKDMPELAEAKRARYTKDMGLPQYDAEILTHHKNISDLFESIAQASKQPKEAVNLITGDIMRLLKSAGIPPEDLGVDGGKLATLVTYVTTGKISRNAYKEAVEAVFADNADPEEYIKSKGLFMVSDTGAAAKAAAEIVAANPAAAADYRAGTGKAFGYLMGQLMKKLGGTANTETAKKALEAELKK